jgi:twitching motility two-component system response regulator PilH
MPAGTPLSPDGNSGSDPGSVAILVVDNEPQTSETLVRTILRPRGYQPQVVRTGRRGLDHIRRNTLDLLLLSWDLPDMAGHEFLQALAESGRRVPCIVLAHPGSEYLAVEAFRLGARGYLTKPLDGDETIRAIRRVLTESWGRRRDDRVVDSLRRRLQSYVVLAQVALPLISISQPEKLHTHIVDGAVLVSGAHQGFLLLLDPETAVLELRAVRLAEQEMTQLVRYAAGETPARQAIRSGTPVHVSGDNLGTSGMGIPVQETIHVPLGPSDRVLGVLSVDRESPADPFTPEDEEMLVQFAGYAALALRNLENTRQRERARQMVADELTVLQRSLSLLETSLPELDDRQRELTHQIQHAIERATRHLSRLGSDE